MCQWDDDLLIAPFHTFLIRLCQRMSWALYEHLNVGTTTMPDNTETNLYSVSCPNTCVILLLLLIEFTLIIVLHFLFPFDKQNENSTIS